MVCPQRSMPYGVPSTKYALWCALNEVCPMVCPQLSTVFVRVNKFEPVQVNKFEPLNNLGCTFYCIYYFITNLM